MTKIRSFDELYCFETFEDRLEYLKLGGGIGRSTFGFDRYLNQKFYSSREWKQVRSYVISRDHGCDLGVLGYEIHVDLLIHHMNPMNIKDIVDHEEWILDPNYLITTTHNTHNIIHYGTENKYPKVVTKRVFNDTKLW